MLISETFLIALHSIRGNLFRAALTMLGIIIGVAAVITMVALGTGAQRAVDKEMEALGGDILSIAAGAWFNRGVSRDLRTLTTDDAMALARESERIAAVVPEISQRFQVKYGNQNINIGIIGTTPNFPEVHGFEMAAGQMYTSADDSSRKRVAVLAAEVPGMLGTDAAGIVGRSITIRGINFDVVGVFKAKGTTGWRNPDDDILIPLSTAQYRVTGNEFLENISAKVSADSSVELAMLDIERILRRSHAILPGKDNDVTIFNRKQFLDSRQEANKIFAYLLAGIAGISLLVGGIGIMNIMLVTVTERTREIGIRKALGATRTNILLQFLIESMTLCIIGGGLGIALGSGTAFLAAKFAGWQTVVTTSSVLMAFAFSAAVGLFFGIMPAQRAARLDPIDALRYE